MTCSCGDRNKLTCSGIDESALQPQAGDLSNDGDE